MYRVCGKPQKLADIGKSLATDCAAAENFFETVGKREIPSPASENKRNFLTYLTKKPKQ